MLLKIILIGLYFFNLATGRDLSWKHYPYQDPHSTIRFPEDEGGHKMIPNLEWWYTVIHAKGEESGESYSILVTHFNNHFRFFTVTNLDRKQHISGTTVGQLNSKIGFLDLQHKTKYGIDIYRSRVDSNNQLIPFEYEIKTHHKRMNLDVTLSGIKKPLMIKGSGHTEVGSSGHTWYYSLTRLDVSGTLDIDGVKEKIKGEAWMDHQWGPFIVSPVSIGNMFESYEWFCLQLNDGSDLMISNIFDRDFNLPLDEKYGGVEIIDVEGSSKYTANRKFTRLGYWQDPVSGHYMSMGWRLEVPEWKVDLTFMPNFLEQMVHMPFNGDFWEGSIKVTGTIAGKNVWGNAFGELIHRYQVPQIEIKKIKINKPKTFIEISWKINNPDAGNPLTYQVELIQSQKKWVLAKDLKEKEGHFLLPQNLDKKLEGKGREKMEVRVIGSSVDKTLVGYAQKYLSSTL